jgi:hypothetical protein
MGKIVVITTIVVVEFFFLSNGQKIYSIILPGDIV